MNHFYFLKHEILFLALPDLYLIVKQLNGNPCTMQSLPSRLNCMVSRDSSPRALWNDFAWAPLDSLLGIHSEWNTVRFGCVLQCSCFAKRLSYFSKTSFHSPLSHCGHIVVGDQKSFVLPR